MKVVFAHDHIFYKYKDNFYSTGGLSKNMIERYSNIFEEVAILSRQKEIKDLNDKLTLSSTKRVTFIDVPNFKSIKNYYMKIKAKKIIEKEVQNSDFVIARNSSIALIAIKYAKKYKKPYLLEVVACPWDSLWNYSVLGKMLAPFAYYSTKKAVKEAPYVVYVTNEFLQKRYPTNGKNINCSNVALTEFDDKVLCRRLEKIESIKKSDKIIIGTTAAINVRFKGQQYIIEALGKLKKQGITKYEYQLVGGGDKSYLESIAKKHDVLEQVKFLGTMPHNKVFEWLETIDLYVQPSKQEGLPRALIEAMSRAVPAFGAKTAGIPELLDGKFIFSNTRKNIDEICEILKSFDKETMAEQAKRNYEESMKYGKEVIEGRRRRFFEEFKKIEQIN